MTLAVFAHGNANPFPAILLLCGFQCLAALLGTGLLLVVIAVTVRYYHRSRRLPSDTKPAPEVWHD